MRLYLGTWQMKHIERSSKPLMVSMRQLWKGRRFKPFSQRGFLALDSGGFTELTMNGKWSVSPLEYVERINHYEPLGLTFDFATQQDWMCEPIMLENTGLTVREHQRRTVDNFLELRTLDCDTPIIPVLQGYALDEYKDCFEMFESSGVDLRAESLVGLGSVCRRQSSDDIERIVSYFHAKDLRLHGFGVKTNGLKKYGEMLSSVDSMAWSFDARYGQRHCSVHANEPKTPSCNNCLTYAEEWHDRVKA